MDILRGRLIGKIDDILSQVVSQETPPKSQLQIEANLVLPQDSTGLARRVVLDCIDVEDLRHHVASHGGTPTSSSSCPAPHDANMALGLPSPIETVSSKTMVTPFVGYAAPDGTDPATTNATLPSQLMPLDLGSDTPSTLPSAGQSVIEQTPPTTPPVGHSTHDTIGGDRTFPKRRKQDHGHPHKPEQSTIDKLIEGIWEQIHNPKSLAMGDDLKETMQWVLERMSSQTSRCTTTNLEFSNATKCCRQITTSSRTARALEVIVQAHWVDCYDARLGALREDRPDLRSQEHKKIVLTEACTAFSWSEKELRNRMAIWKGYREIKDAAGWCALTFAGPGIYRFCKYRLGFDEDAIDKLRGLRLRSEVAADTLQPQWRQLLSLVGESTQIQWRGHPHDWTVSKKKGEDPLPLAVTYKQWDANFTYKHLKDSIIDRDLWGDTDPRQFEKGPEFYCKTCSQRQSSVAQENECECFSDLYSPNPRTPTPVQIFRTDNGKNNGLVACCSFERGQAVGEFVGMITKGLADVDVMQSQAGENEPYQIWQGRCGNFTRFMNHSCAPNCQFETFSWLGVQRIVVVSKGVAAGKELTVDYSGRYWDNLDKICLCGEPCCRYKDRRLPAPV
ncbi:hypothetical protein LTR70_004771 [Exophiala xenobiotica]|uniref:SET domain-containing protein n=1 Tax=Lithohypha guttulata TaxID=1690604 RepID=A0ABR0KCR8_9EURO|nr:hypothetical protein LTR24_004263 [Lithohypha guttulata]KAK5319861.1 hypothetical protein LTR70_004771 [Exophiala xenobiotica]